MQKEKEMKNQKYVVQELLFKSESKNQIDKEEEKENGLENPSKKAGNDEVLID